MRRSAIFAVGLVSASLASLPVYGQSVGGIVGGVVREVGGAVGGATGGGSGGSGGGMSGVDGLGGLGAGDILTRTTDSVMGGGGLGNGTLAGVTQDMIEPSLNRRGWVTAEALETMYLDFADLRRQRIDYLVRTNPKELEYDAERNAVRKGELIAVDPDPRALQLAVAAGLKIRSDERDAVLGIRTVTFKLARGMSAKKAMETAAAIPGLQLEYNHVYEPAGGALAAAPKSRPAGKTSAKATTRAGARIVMIDGGIASHPAFRGASIEQRGFAGAAQATGHGTAVGSLLVGNQDAFRGAARGSQLFVADVYGGRPQAGSASTVLKALSWAATKNPSVINISLVGPANALLGKAIAAVQRRGITVVAAVGNDGPASPIAYPASYPGVIAVTGVDGANKVLLEASRTRQVSFGAPGADLVAAAPGNHFVEVRGTSFAAPLATARIAMAGSATAVRREAVPARGNVGYGVVCRNCTLSPKAFKVVKKY